MIGEQKNLSNSKIKTKKKGVVKFHLVNDSIK